MPVKQNIPYCDGLYFITLTCYKWLPLIKLTNTYDCIYKWFNYLVAKNHYVTGYVIMPNHLHILIGFSSTTKSIDKIIGDGKRFIAYEITKRLKRQNMEDILMQLQSAVEVKDKQRGKLHEVWMDSFDWKECRSKKYINQKLNYIHANPCSGKWNLAASPEEYAHSPADFYLNGVSTTFV